MKNMKRTLALLMVFFLLCAAYFPSVEAAGQEQNTDVEIPVKNQYIQGAKCSIFNRGSTLVKSPFPQLPEKSKKTNAQRIQEEFLNETNHDPCPFPCAHLFLCKYVGIGRT